MARKPSKAWGDLHTALVAAGMPGQVAKNVRGAVLEFDHGVNTLVNTGIDAAPFAEVLLEYAPQLRQSREVEMVARCMMQPKGFKQAVPWLLSVFEGYPSNGLDESCLWAIGEALYRINDKTCNGDVMRLCYRNDLGIARSSLIGFLPRMKSDEAYELLLTCLDDKAVRGWAIEALGRFGRVEAIDLLEALPVQKGLYEFKAKQTALRRLRRKLES